jgi:hypothetical protein
LTLGWRAKRIAVLVPNREGRPPNGTGHPDITYQHGKAHRGPKDSSLAFFRFARTCGEDINYQSIAEAVGAVDRCLRWLEEDRISGRTAREIKAIQRRLERRSRGEAA